MSQEQPPVRSRRELRQARDEKNQAAGPGCQLSPASKHAAAGRCSAPGGLATPGQHATWRTPARGTSAGRAAGWLHAPWIPCRRSAAERSSQIRARDRAALRTIKELEEKEGQLSGRRPSHPPAAAAAAAQGTGRHLGQSCGPARCRRPVPPAQPAGRASRRPRPARRAQAARRSARPQRQQPQATPASAGAAGRRTELPDGMSVEQALAARSLIAEQAKNQLAKMEHIASTGSRSRGSGHPGRADRPGRAGRRPEPPGHGQAETGRAGGTCHGFPEPATSRPPGSTAGSNAAGPGHRQQPRHGDAAGIRAGARHRPACHEAPGNIACPGRDQPGTQGPAAGAKDRRPSGARSAAGAPLATGTAAPGLLPGPKRPPGPPPSRSRQLPRDPAAGSRAGEDLFADLPRIPAQSAHGLEPLDAATAGLARANRLRLMQVLVLVFGIVALISGVILIISGMSR